MIDALLIDDGLQDEMMGVFGQAAWACFQCGACTATCPWGIVSERSLSIREMMRRAQLSVGGAGGDVWLCTDCGQCLQSCPRGVPVSRVFQAWRGQLWKKRTVESGLTPVLWSVYWNGNPLSQPPSERMNWADGLDVPLFDAKEHEYLLFVGCTASYDPRAQKAARALVRILNTSGSDYGVLGEQERCCGECVLRMGHRPYFEDIARANLEQFRKAGVRRVVTISPHCYDAFNNHYPDRKEFVSIHYSQLLLDLLASGKIDLESTPSSRLSFHDPCLLSRANPEYETPREILAHFDGIEFEELDRSRAETLCCGGGGGRIFLETLPDERFSNLRIQEAQQHAIQTLLTTCPLCISCLEDSRSAIQVENLKVLDLAEFIVSAIVPDGRE
ncbi:MAG: (Fe-S)-binding protein [Anaerolineales bacterium]|nr:(Fe-S)-binding protein [Anaerolineales bacterium]